MVCWCPSTPSCKSGVCLLNLLGTGKKKKKKRSVLGLPDFSLELMCGFAWES